MKNTQVTKTTTGYRVTTVRSYGAIKVNYNHWFKTEKQVNDYLNRVKF